MSFEKMEFGMSVSIFGACSDLGSDRYGSSRGPKYIIPNAPLLCTSTLERCLHVRRGEDLASYDQEFIKKVELLHAEHLEEIKVYVTDIIASGNKPLMVGGDHSLSYSVLKAILEHKDKIHLLHFDAHTDDNYSFAYGTPKHGDFLYYLKRDYPKQLKVTYISSYPEISLYGKLAKKPHQVYIKENENIYVSIDVDCLIREEMSTTGFPRDEGKQGLICDEITSYLVELSNRNVEIVGGDLVEFGIKGNIEQADLNRAKILVTALEQCLKKIKDYRQ